MVYYFALFIFAFVVASFVGAALTWDGAFYLYQALDLRQPFTPHSRYFNFFAQFPAVVTSWHTDNINVIQFVFGLGYVIFPIASLLLCWFILRKSNARDLFVWVVLGTNLALWPGQFSITTEAVIVIHMVWPLVLIALLPYRAIYGVIIVVLSALIFIAHPSSIVLFAMVGGINLVVALRYKELRRQKLFWFVLFTTLALIAFLHFRSSETSYEADQLSLQTLTTSYLSAVQGIPLWGIILQIIASIALLVERFVWKRNQVSLVTMTVELLTVGAIALLFLLRASVSRMWTGTLDFRTWALVSSLPIFGFAVLERISLPVDLDRIHSLWQHRKRTIFVVGTMFAVIFVAQSLAWYGMGQQLNQTVEASNFPCITDSSIGWMEATPLNHWSVTFYSLLKAGPTPDHVVLGWGHCATEDFHSRDNLVGWSIYDSGTDRESWFHLAPLETALQSQTTLADCVFSITDGWYWVEQRGSSRWYWMPDRADVNLYLRQPTGAVLTGNVLSVPLPNKMDVTIDGEPFTSTPVDNAEATEFRIQLPTLSTGAHTITILSETPPVIPPGDSRLISFGIENLDLQTLTSPCTLLP